VTEKDQLRLRFKVLAKEFFAKHDDAAFSVIHREIDEKLEKYIASLATKPKCIAIYEPMRFELPVREFTTLNKFQLLIPQWNSQKMWFDNEPDCVIVPGLFVDKLGNRLGRGKGYYDKYFAVNPLPISQRIFLGYDFQFLEKIPADAFDQPVTAIQRAE